ncbi:MAG TPA: RNA chaperone Hfq [Terriglobales bacterium]|nr:RNA chaperone Hfq [Terriglobales bacterium]
MKDAIDSIPAERSLQAEGFANRKLIRPSLNRSEHSHAPQPVASERERERRDRPERSAHSDRNGHDRSGQDRPNGGGKKPAPLEQTNAENFYYQKQMQSKTPMVIVLRDGEEIHGTLEWYDKACIKVNRSGASNLMIYKPAIKYMYKEGENSR